MTDWLQNAQGQFLPNVCQCSNVAPRHIRDSGKTLAFRRGLHVRDGRQEVVHGDVEGLELFCAQRRDGLYVIGSGGFLSFWDRRTGVSVGSGGIGLLSFRTSFLLDRLHDRSILCSFFGNFDIVAITPAPTQQLALKNTIDCNHRRLLRQTSNIGAHEPRRLLRQHLVIQRIVHSHLFRHDPEYPLPCLFVGCPQNDLAIESTRPSQCRIHGIGTIRRPQHHDGTLISRVFGMDGVHAR
mmetsp:Transcript_30424/g.51869  ORF Transcript_30424/g.51869 Transcript_30424/m.51869 type:complete len:239 (+) Transcript_30424:1008-1724(+)